MAEEINNNKTRRTSKLRRCAFIVITIAALALILILIENYTNRRTIEEEIAAIDKKLAVADEDNAALLYEKLFATVESDSFYPEDWDGPDHDSIMRKPWSDEDHPELAQWIKGHESTISQIMEATEKPKYHFLIRDYFGSVDSSRYAIMRQMARLLIYSANNDLGQANSSRASEKFFAILRMGNHMRQQPTGIELLVGISIESMAVAGLNNLIVGYPIEPEQLELIDSKLQFIQDNPSIDWKTIHRIRHLSNRTYNVPFYKSMWKRFRTGDTDRVIEECYQLFVARNRASRIIVALRKYKNANGNWPESLDQIKESTLAEIFTDPANGGEYVYRLEGENFVLYSKGSNAKDEDGEFQSKWDPNSLRPKTEALKDDRMVWPRIKRSKEE